jgi:hypothetical protein
MKKILIFLCFFTFSIVFSQVKIYKYYIHLYDSSMIPPFENIKGNYKYVGIDGDLSLFFDNYKIIKFEKEFPMTDWESFSRVLRLETTDASLAKDLISHYPKIFKKYDDLTNEAKPELLDYPDDYGTTNPNGNSGANINRDDLDYINVQKAWNITTGIGAKIGISDARINITDDDFVDKVSFVNPGNYQSMPYNPSNMETWHGTNTAGIAAARGNNAHGSTGICYNCDIIGTAYGSYPNLLALAQAGVRVINMSWANLYSTKEDKEPGHEVRQMTIDSLVNHYKIVLVAAAGNESSYQTNTDYYCWGGNENGPSYTGTRYGFPASYNGVISVSSVHHKYPLILPLVPDVNVSPSYCCLSPTGVQNFISIQDSFSGDVDGIDPYNPISIFYNGYSRYCNVGQSNQYVSSPLGISSGIHTANSEVDILAPTHDTFRFDKFIEENNSIVYTGGGTSGSSPRVAGTAALMISVNSCLLPSDVDTVLKLTTREVENLSMNQIYQGQIGAGALNAGDAVEFVNEMKKINGNAIIDNHIFNRFNFNLQKINNKLTIQNIVFKDNNVSDFSAKNSIDVLDNSDFMPNSSGYVDLKINSAIDITCTPIVINKNSNKLNKNIINKKIVSTLYPNPNNGNFVLYFDKSMDIFDGKINIEIYDVSGKLVYQEVSKKEASKSINVNMLSDGFYIVKITCGNYIDNIKFLKN